MLKIYLALRLIQHLIEVNLSRLNARYWSNAERQKSAAAELEISSDDMTKSAQYSLVKHRFSILKATIVTVLSLGFIAFGGLGIVEGLASEITSLYLDTSSELLTGIVFFLILMLASQVLSLPFALYHTFVIEERFGFNKQTGRGFFVDIAKGLLLGFVLGVPLLALILYIIEAAGDYWWVLAWATMSVFSLLVAWLYPTLLAPLFNKFKRLEDGELKSKIDALSKQIGFATDGVFVMDASKRSAHGNAYFTGIFGKKRIVLFDTLLSDMSSSEVTAVLAHELGHFKLHHVRNSMIRGLVMSLAVFYLMSILIHEVVFFEAFSLSPATSYGGLIVFVLWFSMVEFLMQPLETWLSRRNEFAADDFARVNLGRADDMISALKKLREKSFVMPLSHPLYSAIYHSHPPMLERLRALRT